MNTPLVLTDFLDRAVRLYGEKPAIIDEEGTRYTYHEINKRVNQLSHGLASLGVEKGDRVAYLAPNTLEMYEGFYGIFQVGGIMVSLNTRLKPDDYLYILNHSGSKILFVDHELISLIEPIIDQLKTVEQIIIHGASEDKGDFIAYPKWLVSQPDTAFPRADLDENDTATLLYTSGTTGKPKGVMLTHRNNYLHAMSSMHHIRVSDKDTLMHILPMFHVNGWGSPFYYTANGSTQVMQRYMDSASILNKVKKYGVTVMHMAPTVLNGIIDKFMETKPVIEQDVRIVLAGAAPPQAFIKQVEEEIGWEFYQVYGMTESSPLTLASYMSSEDGDLTGDDYYYMKAKAGYEMIGTKVRVVNDMHQDVANDGKEVGEVIVKGNGVMKGYWKNEEETNRTIVDGWLHTGDMGTIDERSRINIVDRKKDIIISGGENISSIEVEGVFYEHPAVQEVAIIATPHEKWGETPHAIVVLRKGHIVTEQELIDFSREKLAHFKCPKAITFLDELPKTASGKILKVQLRELV
ncbi:long-chain-fatty-acid--CoA ligase [Virgibacillus alimentarius]|uniref:long-chain-fatty-acid--CoA ligase n=1 Tax=Virgibacillus alimentarius TaxID=698769 RepID=UPI000492F428|nr:long-chain-fatty-acid--CoA ligase [Virgibacillus alimentarius]